MNIYEEYAKAKLQIDILTAKLRELEPQILEEVKVLSVPMKTEMGTFTTATRKSYKFPDEIQSKIKDVMDDAKKAVTNLEKVTIESGAAELVESVGLRFIKTKVGEIK